MLPAVEVVEVVAMEEGQVQVFNQDLERTTRVPTHCKRLRFIQTYKQ